MKQTDLLIVKGMRFPCPMNGMSITSTPAVSAGRNTNGATVGKLVGRRMYQLNNLQWNGLTIEPQPISLCTSTIETAVYRTVRTVV